MLDGGEVDMVSCVYALSTVEKKRLAALHCCAVSVVLFLCQRQQFSSEEGRAFLAKALFELALRTVP
jgi:hypothetical protein